MGIGNLESRASRRRSTPTPASPHRLSYAQVYFDSGARRARDAYELLSGFGDESADYLWKVLASERILARYRKDPEALAATAELATNKATMEEVFHPENETEVFDDRATIEDAIDDGDLLPLPDEPVLGWEPDPDIGELARRARPVAGALPGAAPRGAGDAHLPGRPGAEHQRRRRRRCR